MEPKSPRKILLLIGQDFMHIMFKFFKFSVYSFTHKVICKNKNKINEVQTLLKNGENVIFLSFCNFRNLQDMQRTCIRAGGIEPSVVQKKS